MSMKTRATLEALYAVPDNCKAEIVNGEVVLMAPTGEKPNRASFKICLRLYEHELATGGGLAVADNAGFSVDLPSRQSFSPDAAWYVGPPADMRFFTGAPRFAAEIRSANDYGSVAEREMAAKRDDYFAAGTLVVWDVDLLGKDVVRSYRADQPNTPRIFRRGEIADAEPAVPGWSMAVDDLFK